MSTPQNLDARRLYRVAFQRHDEAYQIIKRLELWRVGTYLAGYVVECILKAVIIEDTPRDEQSGIVSEFKGKKAHNYEFLRHLLKERNVLVPSNLAGEFAFVGTWSVDLRYEPGPGRPDEALRFLEATKKILNWADGRI